MDLKEIFKGKSLLYIPIVSMQDRNTGEYKLDCDGNVNRFITTFTKNDTYSELTIVLPRKHKKYSNFFIENFASQSDKVSLVYMNNFGQHAKDQRVSEEICKSIININNTEYYDHIIFESQTLGKMLLERYPEKLIYWCPVCKTDNKTRDFLEGYDGINKLLFEKSKYVIVASVDQVRYIEDFLNISKDKVTLKNEFIDRSLDIFKTEYEDISEIYDLNHKYVFYIPYRISDKGYKVDKLIEQFKIMNDNGDDFIVYYSAPNSIGLQIDDVSLANRFHQVNTFRSTVYNFLDCPKVIVPYFEDIDFIHHALVDELKSPMSECQVVVLPNSDKEIINNKRFKMLNSIKEFSMLYI